MITNQNTDSFKSGLKYQPDNVKRDTMIVTCDLTGSFKQVNGDKKVLIDNLNKVNGKKYFITRDGEFINGQINPGDVLIAEYEKENEKSSLGKDGFINVGLKKLNEEILKGNECLDYEH